MGMKFWRNYLKEMTIIVGVILLVFLMMDYNTRLEKLNELNEKIVAVRAEATAVAEMQIALETQIADATSESITEREVRSNGEIREGDHKIVPIPAAGAPLLDMPTPTSAPEQMMKWQIWEELFFGE